jgi:hypothetical protein
MCDKEIKVMIEDKQKAYKECLQSGNTADNIEYNDYHHKKKRD